MAEAIPANPGMALVPAQPQSLMGTLTDPAGGTPLERARGFLAQGPVKKALPWFAGMAVLGGAAVAWSTLAPAPQRVLYAQLDDAERASVVGALDKGNIHYRIDSSTGALTVDEGDVYKARMLVAQNGALALPDTASDSLDKLPMGASRALEGERLRAAREHELMLSIKEIDGVQAVRVHLAEGEKSVFVRDQIAPSASVMLRLADGRQLSENQVSAIVNLVAGSVPGLTPDAVKVVDQRGHLLSQKGSVDSDRMDMQSRMEEKLRGQVATLLTPMLGDGNFTSEIQVDLDMDQVTSARESYDKQGAVRSETSQQSQQPASAAAIGVPGTLSNTPPPSTTPSPGAPGAPPPPAPGTPPPAAGAAGAAAPGAAGATPAATPSPTASESSATKNYELGREVAVSNTGPGKIKRLSVAVALSASAMAKFKQSDIDQIKQLVSAAVGADTSRGDQIAVVARAFDTTPVAKTPFYETPWFAQALHYGGALIGLLMVLLLAVRPLINALKGGKPASGKKGKTSAVEEALANAPMAALPLAAGAPPIVNISGAAAAAGEGMPALPGPSMGNGAEALNRHVGLAQQIVTEKPDSAVIALRQMLQPPAEKEDA
ncbi:flagellar basal-body MS-ring/collar protein FliF [Novosphingobium rosa]|uniref:flagellar basal-body MS-ring/collar protein FliF n=1 Tax=Novosphingobium rosa TaxID=76978 RepID=UPI000831F14C|nr:flagellar basal-body MS-ring/collar protein FliF [Novosphingobium rosa]